MDPELVALRKARALEWSQKKRQEVIEIEEERVKQRELQTTKDVLSSLDYFVKEIDECKSFLEVSVQVSQFTDLFDRYYDDVKRFDLVEDASVVVMSLVGAVSSNVHTSYDIRNEDERAVQLVLVSNIKSCLTRVGCDPESMDLDTMDTSGDADIAKLIAEEEQLERDMALARQLANQR